MTGTSIAFSETVFDLNETLIYPGGTVICLDVPIIYLRITGVSQTETMISLGGTKIDPSGTQIDFKRAHESTIYQFGTLASVDFSRTELATKGTFVDCSCIAYRPRPSQSKPLANLLY
ncbi:MAG: hypothetical protein LUD38_05665 [Parabacteroides sp.]|nr:hypothetical protein [Parabacteroides sp.]